MTVHHTFVSIIVPLENRLIDQDNIFSLWFLCFYNLSPWQCIHVKRRISKLFRLLIIWLSVLSYFISSYFCCCFCQVWFKNKRAKYRQQKKQQHPLQNKSEPEKRKPSPPPPPPDQARKNEKIKNPLDFRGVTLPQTDVAELLKQNCQTLTNIQRQGSYQPSRSVNNNFESLLADLTSAAMQPAQLHSSKVQGFPDAANFAAPIPSNMAINPGIQTSYFTSVTMQH